MRVIDWGEFAAPPAAFDLPLAVTVGVFDGVHLGHRALIRRILAEDSCLSTVVTFRRNPLETVDPGGFAGNIFDLDRKLLLLDELGVGLAVLIDFSPEFCMMRGRDFIDLLLGCHRTRLIALGGDFRCGRGLDTGADEIRGIAGALGVETWLAPPVMDGGRPVSSSRIRQALAAGRIA
ncbi:MAG: riboflavin biosynthesis protein RibF, partial [Treponema sp.]|nr:riboflavin biosynthesis protein RibF [Treponema sp.]